MHGGKTKTKANDEIIAQFLNELEKVNRYSPNTIRAYRNDLDEFITKLNEKSRNITQTDFRDVRDFIYFQHQKGNSPRTVGRKLASIKSLYRFLLRIGEIASNPADLIIPPKEKRELPAMVSLETITEVLDGNEPSSILEIRDFAILEVFFGTGVRLSELANLKISSIRQNFISVVGKGNKKREIPLTIHAKTALSEYFNIRSELLGGKEDSGYVFLSRNGRQLTTRDIARRVKLCLRKSSVQSADNPHALRHAYATQLLEGGADIRVIKELLGHSNLSTTQQYTHVGIERLRNIYKQAHPRADKEME